MYLSVTDHIYAYKGNIDKKSILYPHHLGLQIIDTLESSKEEMDDALMNNVWKVFVTLRDKLISKLLQLEMYSKLPTNSIEFVIICLYEKYVKGKDLISVESFSKELCEVFNYLDINDVFECILSKNQLCANERICVLYTLYQHYSLIDPIRIEEWKLKIAERWTDERLFLISSIESKEILTLSVACTLGYVYKEDAMKYECLLQGVMMRMSSLDERIRCMGMIVGEMISKLLPIEDGLRFDKRESELNKLLYWAFRFGDVVQQSGKCSVKQNDLIECIDDDSEDEILVHEDIKLRNKYIERGEAIPRHKTHLIEPKNLQQALDWFMHDKDRVKMTLTIDHLHGLICTSSALYMNSNYLEIMKALLTIPNTYNLTNYEVEMQRCFNAILRVPWIDNDNKQTTDNVRREVLSMMHKMWYGDLNEEHRTMMMNVHQRLQMFTRIVMCIDDKVEGNGARQVVEEKERCLMSLEDKYPLLKMIEQVHRSNDCGKRERVGDNSMKSDKLDLMISVTRHFLIPFLRQASMEYIRFFNQSHCNLILERVLLFTALMMDKVMNQPIYIDLVQRVLVFVRQVMLRSIDEKEASGGRNLREMPMIKAVLFNLRQVVSRWPTSMDPFLYAPLLMDVERYLGDIGNAILDETEGLPKKDAELLILLWTGTMQGVQELTDAERLLRRKMEELELCETKDEIKQISARSLIRMS